MQDSEVVSFLDLCAEKSTYDCQPGLLYSSRGILAGLLLILNQRVGGLEPTRSGFESVNMQLAEKSSEREREVTFISRLIPSKSFPSLWTFQMATFFRRW